MDVLTAEQITKLLSEPSEKQCSACKQIKPVTEFNNNSSKSDGKSSKCKNCNKDYLKQHYTDNPEYYKNKSRKYKSDLRELINRLKILRGCNSCGFNEHPAVLDFHHRDGTNKSFNIGSSLHLVSRELLMEEIAKCDVLCANCHRIKSYS
jgi:hypothetical protein